MPLVIVVNPSLGFKTLKDYLALDKRPPQKRDFVSSGKSEVAKWGKVIRDSKVKVE